MCRFFVMLRADGEENPALCLRASIRCLLVVRGEKTLLSGNPDGSDFFISENSKRLAREVPLGRILNFRHCLEGFFKQILLGFA